MNTIDHHSVHGIKNKTRFEFFYATFTENKIKTIYSIKHSVEDELRKDVKQFWYSMLAFEKNVEQI